MNSITRRHNQLQTMQTTRERRKAKGDAVQSAPPTPSTIQLASVRRRKWGTSAFDENWLNLDCCGLVCAAITYMLHAYGVYAVCFILIPPWMSSTTTEEEHIRSISIFGHLHRILFVVFAALACAAHFYAMTTDPGAVPPDATPVPEPDEGADEESSELILSTTQKGRRLCRRCKSFKPQRAHHCR